MKAPRIAAVCSLAFLLAIPLVCLAGDDSPAPSAQPLLQVAQSTDPARSSEQGLGPAPGKGPFGRRGALREFISKELGLSDDQKERMQKLRKDSREKTRETRQAMRKIGDEKLKMLLTGKVNLPTLERLDQELANLHTTLYMERLRARRELLAQLTGDQLKRLGQFLSKKKEQRRSALEKTLSQRRPLSPE